MNIAEQKKRARLDAALRRDAAHENGQDASMLAAEHLIKYLGSIGDPKKIALYMPIRSEMDSMIVMQLLFAFGYELCLPVVMGAGQPLSFRFWGPLSEMQEGAFGVSVPSNSPSVVPDVVVAPLLAFNKQGYRLGYGGGFYDRTLEVLRRDKQVHAVGYAYAAQQGDVPTEVTDQRLDAIVTEQGITKFDIA